MNETNDRETVSPDVMMMAGGFDAPEIVEQDIDKANAKAAEVQEHHDEVEGDTGQAKAEETIADDQDAKADDIAETDGKDVTEGEEVITDHAPVETDEVGELEKEVATLRRKTELLAEKNELLAKIREQTKSLLDQGATLQNTSEPMPEQQAVENIDQDLNEIPAIEDTDYISKDKKEEE